MNCPYVVKKNIRRKTRSIKPFIQGSLDNYCGMYSVVNAIHYLCGPISLATGNELLYESLKFLEVKRTAAERIIDGTTGREIRKVLNGCFHKNIVSLQKNHFTIIKTLL